jgi:hypothetical protein
MCVRAWGGLGTCINIYVCNVRVYIWYVCTLPSLRMCLYVHVCTSLTSPCMCMCVYACMCVFCYAAKIGTERAAKACIHINAHHSYTPANNYPKHAIYTRTSRNTHTHTHTHKHTHTHMYPYIHRHPPFTYTNESISGTSLSTPEDLFAGAEISVGIGILSISSP